MFRLIVAGILFAQTICVHAHDPPRVFIRAGAKTHGPNQHDHPRLLREWTPLLMERGMQVEGGAGVSHYYAVSIETKDDFSYDGMVLRENRSMVVIRNQTAETTLRKDDIVSRRTRNRSIMPEGFEALGTEALRDLLTFLCADEQRYRILHLTSAFTPDYLARH